jgi:hypothetical protein
MFHEHKIHNYINLSLFQKEANFRVLHRSKNLQQTEIKALRNKKICNKQQKKTLNSKRIANLQQAT